MKKSKSQNVSRVAATLFALSGLMACGSSNSSKTPHSAVKVTNGVAVQDVTYPSTVLLVSLTQEGEGICTGTFVNDSQVVTAGHCVEGLSATNPYIFFATEKDGQIELLAQATAFVRQPSYNIAQGVSPYDLSVITFPAETAPAVTPIAAKAPAVGEPFTIVGYGNNENFINSFGALDGSGSGVKRAGVNRISDVSGGMIGFVGVPGSTRSAGTAAGQLAASGSGDSGGPMFVGNSLVGVTSGGGLQNLPTGEETSISFYVDLNSPMSRQFLARALKKAAL